MLNLSALLQETKKRVELLPELGKQLAAAKSKIEAELARKERELNLSALIQPKISYAPLKTIGEKKPYEPSPLFKPLVEPFKSIDAVTTAQIESLKAQINVSPKPQTKRGFFAPGDLWDELLRVFNMANIFTDIIGEFKKIPELFSAKKKEAESARTAQQVQARLNDYQSRQVKTPDELRTAQSTVPFATTEFPAIKQPLFTAKAPEVISQTYPLNVAYALGSVTIDTVARLGVQLAKNLNALTLREPRSPAVEKVLSSINPEAIGINGRLQTTGQRLWERYDELNKQTPPKKTIDVWRNALLASKDVIIPDVFDAFIAEAVINLGARQALKATYSTEYSNALKTLSLKDNFTWDQLKNNFIKSLETAVKAGDRKAVNDIMASGMTINSELTVRGGQVSLNPLGKVIQKIGSTLTTPIENFGKIVFPKPLTLVRELPGEAIAGEPQPAFGLSIRPVKKVGGVPEVPKGLRAEISQEYLEGYRNYVAELKKAGSEPVSFEQWVKFKGMQDLRKAETFIPKELEPLKGVKKITEEIPTRLPAVIQGETFTLGEFKTIQPTIKELRAGLKAEIKATKQEIKNAEIAAEKVAKLEAKQQKIRQDTIKNINRFHGDTERITKLLKSRYLVDEDIANIVLEDGTKFTDVIKVKRNPDRSLSTYITRKEIDDIAKSYTDKIPKQKWEKRSVLVEGVEIPIKVARGIETPAVFFERKGIGYLRDSIIGAQRASKGYGIKGELAKTGFINRFKEAGLAKDAGLLTADRFTLSKNEAEGVAKYYLGRQGKGAEIPLEQLSEKGRKFVEIFDNIIKETEGRFYETAKKMGKTPGKVKNYAPLMTSEDIKLIDKGGAMNWLFRNHPAFFSLKERMKKAPIELYELDYRKVVARWIDGITDFIHISETTNHLKYLTNSNQFKNIVKESDWKYVNKWLQEITTPYVSQVEGEMALTALSKFGRKAGAMGALGLNYASVLKQALTQIPIMIIDKAVPKTKSKFAQAFGIDVAQLPSITIRKGDIAIQDLQGKIGRTFTGPLTEFDRKNAQVSLNGYLDKFGAQTYKQWEKTGIRPQQEVIDQVVKTSQDRVDLWYGSFYQGDRPDFFKRETGNFILMFLYPLTSQLNGFYRHIIKTGGYLGYQAGEGTAKTVIAIAEVLTAATVIAYIEQVIENLSPKWSDKVGMTRDILQSLTGNIPVVSNVVYAFLNEKEINVSPVIGNINSIVRDFSKDDKEKFLWSVGTTLGIPKTFRRLREGMEIMEAGGITDNEGKMLAPVQDTIEIVRSFLRGKYGSIAAQDWVRNIGEKSENRRWFVPQVEFLQNGDYDRKADLYGQFNVEEQKELKEFLSEAQQKKLDNAIKKKPEKRTLEDIFSGRRSLEEIFR
ncbi:MAG: hypothetical protein QMD65_01990 [Patescibacteria group bacterium]|nr:hypothetical protein [Patescibacteria group bacterium]